MPTRRPLLVALLFALSAAPVAQGADLVVSGDTPAAPDGMPLAGAEVDVDAKGAAVVHAAAGLLASDLQRVTGVLSPVDISIRDNAAVPAAIIVGTIGDGGAVDDLVTAGKVDASGVRGQWETFAWQLVDAPRPGVSRALVIVGSDRRGTAYGCTELSRAIGVSPWAWWADVPVPYHAQLSVSRGRHVDGPPGVKYRGIFLNDEDFGLRPWAHQTFDPELNRTEIGPKTYERLFELMLRLRLNYLWPAMHPGSGEFGSIPGNAEAADKWAVVMGASHCEPMLRNNVYWPKADGAWRYDTNRDHILHYWTEAAEQRGPFEAVWTLGIRGIHDAPMQGPKAVPDRVNMVEGLIVDQRKLIADHVTKQYGPPAECFVPYKEVLPLYDAGLKVPDDVTLVWPDDNFGYIRHLPTAAERRRPGGSGIYYHVSYWGGPHSYLWVESTPLGLIWEELHKAWQNDAGRLWVLNVGDLKPAEVSIDFYSRLAWNPDGWGPDAQDRFLHGFLADTFGPAAAGPIFDLESTFFRTASRRKPEHFRSYGANSKTRPEWLDSLSDGTLHEVGRQYDDLLALEGKTAAAVPPPLTDSYYEMVGYAARALAETGQMYVHLARADRGQDPTANRDAARACYRQVLADTDRYNDHVAGGKWRHMMDLTPNGLDWPAEVGGTRPPGLQPARRPGDGPRAVTVDAAAFTSATPTATAAWHPVAGLGRSGQAIVVLPATPFTGDGPSVTYAFDLPAAVDGARIRLDLLPTMRTDPAGHLRVHVVLIGPVGADAPVWSGDHTVPGGEAGDENSGPRHDAVLSNRVQVELPPGSLAAGRHTLTVTALDPGVVLDQVELPPGATPTAAGR